MVAVSSVKRYGNRARCVVQGHSRELLSGGTVIVTVAFIAFGRVSNRTAVSSETQKGSRSERVGVRSVTRAGVSVSHPRSRRRVFHVVYEFIRWRKRQT